MNNPNADTKKKIGIENRVSISNSAINAGLIVLLPSAYEPV